MLCMSGGYNGPISNQRFLMILMQNLRQPDRWEYAKVIPLWQLGGPGI